jgi:hypothetical protein
MLRPPTGQISLAALRRAFAGGLQVVCYTIAFTDPSAGSGGGVAATAAPRRLRGGEIVSFRDAIPHTVREVPLILEAIGSPLPSRAGLA